MDTDGSGPGVDVHVDVPAPRPRATLAVGVRDPRRLHVVADAELTGHLGDPDLDAIVSTLGLALGVPMAVINIVTPDLQTYAAEIGVGSPCTTVADEVSFCAAVVDTGVPFMVIDASTHPVYGRNPMVQDGSVGAYAGFPLVDDDVVLGSVSVFDARSRQFSEDELEILRLQARMASSFLALRRAARTDVLTGLPNRALFFDRLNRALAGLGRHDGCAAVMYLDIDRFKDLNDTYGHHIGDAVLRTVAHELSGVLRPSDTLARFGGDEFTIVCENLASPTDAEHLAQRLLTASEGPWTVQGHSIDLHLSIGIATTTSTRQSPTHLLRDADTAMYRAKNQPGPSWARAG